MCFVRLNSGNKGTGMLKSECLISKISRINVEKYVCIRKWENQRFLPLFSVYTELWPQVQLQSIFLIFIEIIRLQKFIESPIIRFHDPVNYAG